MTNILLIPTIAGKIYYKQRNQNHKEGLEATFERLVASLFTENELNLIYLESDHAPENIGRKKAWIKVSNLVEPGITDKEQVLIHLLWFQSIRRVVIYDVDPVSGAVLLRLNLDKVQREPKKS